MVNSDSRPGRANLLKESKKAIPVTVNARVSEYGSYGVYQFVYYVCVGLCVCMCEGGGMWDCACQSVSLCIGMNMFGGRTASVSVNIYVLVCMCAC